MKLPLPPIQVKRLNPKAELPEYGTAGAGAFDVKSLESAVIEPGKFHVFKTGLAFAIPEHFMMAMNVRSGMGARHGLRIRNTIGYIDSDYRGELLVVLENGGDIAYSVLPGDRIAQCAIVMAPQFVLKEVDDLPATVRGEGGYGSTGR